MSGKYFTKNRSFYFLEDSVINTPNILHRDLRLAENFVDSLTLIEAQLVGHTRSGSFLKLAEVNPYSDYLKAEKKSLADENNIFKLKKGKGV